MRSNWTIDDLAFFAACAEEDRRKDQRKEALRRVNAKRSERYGYASASSGM